MDVFSKLFQLSMFQSKIQADFDVCQFYCSVEMASGGNGIGDAEGQQCHLCQEKDARIAELESRLQEKDEMLVIQESQINDKEEQLVNMDQQLATANITIQQLEEDLIQMHNILLNQELEQQQNEEAAEGPEEIMDMESVRVSTEIPRLQDEGDQVSDSRDQEVTSTFHVDQ